MDSGSVLPLGTKAARTTDACSIGTPSGDLNRFSCRTQSPGVAAGSFGLPSRPTSCGRTPPSGVGRCFAPIYGGNLSPMARQGSPCCEQSSGASGAAPSGQRGNLSPMARQGSPCCEQSSGASGAAPSGQRGNLMGVRGLRCGHYHFRAVLGPSPAPQTDRCPVVIATGMRVPCSLCRCRHPASRRSTCPEGASN